AESVTIPSPLVAAGGKTNGSPSGSPTGSGSGGVIMAAEWGVGGGQNGPAYLRNPRPPYPRVARTRGWEGTTILRVEVLTDGTGGQVEVTRTSGYSVLDSVSVSTVRTWRFAPARLDNQPVVSWVEVPVRFRLVPS